MKLLRMSALAAACCLVAVSAQAQNMQTTTPNEGSASPNAMTRDNSTMTRGGAMTRGNTTNASVSIGEIAHITSTVDTGEIKLAKLALKNSQNEEVRTYAQHIIDDHTAMLTEGKQIYSSLNVKPVNNATSRTLNKEMNQHFAKLNRLKGAQFDLQYVTVNAQAHAKVGNLIEAQLIPAATEPQLQAYLTNGLGKVRMHQQHAQQLQQTLQNSAPSTTQVN